jgi:hypothetical protein
MMTIVRFRTFTVADPATTWSLWGWRVLRLGPLPTAARIKCLQCDYNSRDPWKLVTSNADEISVGSPVGGTEDGFGASGEATRRRRAVQWFSVITEGDIGDVVMEIDGRVVCRADVLSLLAATATLCKSTSILSSSSSQLHPNSIIQRTCSSSPPYPSVHSADTTWYICIKSPAAVGLLPRHVFAKPFVIVAATQLLLPYAV